jgi:hypothetical protein
MNMFKISLDGRSAPIYTLFEHVQIHLKGEGHVQQRHDHRSELSGLPFDQRYADGLGGTHTA